MRKIVQLFSVIVFIYIIIWIIIFNSTTKFKNINDTSTEITVYDTPATWETVQQPQLNIKALDRKLSNFPGADTMTSLFEIYSALGIKYNIDNFYDTYFNAFELDNGNVYGDFSPELLWAVSNEFFKEQAPQYHCEIQYGKKYNFYEIAANHYPMLIWYDNLYNGTPDYAWQYLDTLVVYNAKNGFIYCKNTENSEIRIKYDEFLKRFNACGNYFLIFGKKL